MPWCRNYGNLYSTSRSDKISTGTVKGKLVVMEMHGEELRVRPARSALRRIQEHLQPLALAPGEPSVSDELIAERRREAADG